MWAAEGLGTLFADMFPNSRPVQKFTLSRTKPSYVINCGLAGYFQRQLQDALKKGGPFTVCFGESLNKVVQRGQMNIAVRYLNENISSCCTQYLTSTFLDVASNTKIVQNSVRAYCLALLSNAACYGRTVTV